MLVHLTGVEKSSGPVQRVVAVGHGIDPPIKRIIITNAGPDAALIGTNERLDQNSQKLGPDQSYEYTDMTENVFACTDDGAMSCYFDVAIQRDASANDPIPLVYLTGPGGDTSGIAQLLAGVVSGGTNKFIRITNAGPDAALLGLDSTQITQYLAPGSTIEFFNYTENVFGGTAKFAQNCYLRVEIEP